MTALRGTYITLYTSFTCDNTFAVTKDLLRAFRFIRRTKAYKTFGCLNKIGISTQHWVLQTGGIIIIIIIIIIMIIIMIIIIIIIIYF